MGIVKPIISTEADISGITSVLSEIKGLANTAAEKSTAAAADAATAANEAATAATQATNAATDAATAKTKASNVDSRLTSTRAGYLDLLANSTNGLAAIKTAVANGGAVKSVQRGVAAIGNGKTLNVTISSVNLSKTIVNIQPFIALAEEGAYDPDNYCAIGRLTSATSLKLYQYVAYTDNKVLWEVIEFK